MEKSLLRIQSQIRDCRDCSTVCGTPVHGVAVQTPILLVGQAPGAHESDRGKPFAYTAGKTLFQWFLEATGVDEEEFRNHVYIAAVARCFPGKSSGGRGDREPSEEEIQRCRRHLRREVEILKPQLVLAVGKVAIREVLGVKNFSLADVVGRKLKCEFHGHLVEVICLPHPSGISVWPRMEPGRGLLRRALRLVAAHAVWRRVFEEGIGDE
jgi:uracil-DNA glycosylase